MIWKVPEAHGDRVIRIKTEGDWHPLQSFHQARILTKMCVGGGKIK